MIGTRIDMKPSTFTPEDIPHVIYILHHFIIPNTYPNCNGRVMLGMPVLSGFGQRIKDPSCKARRRNPPSSSHFSARPSSLIAMVESHTKDACFEQLNGFGERGICVAAV